MPRGLIDASRRPRRVAVVVFVERNYSSCNLSDASERRVARGRGAERYVDDEEDNDCSM